MSAQLGIDFLPAPADAFAGSAADEPELLADIRTIVQAIPDTTYAEGTYRHGVKRPAAYLYAFPASLTEDERERVTHMTAYTKAERRRAGGRWGFPNGLDYWYRLNGSTEYMDRQASRQWRPWTRLPAAPWMLSLSERGKTPAMLRARIDPSLRALGLAVVGRHHEIVATIGQLILALRWCEEIAAACFLATKHEPLGHEWMVLTDQAMVAGLPWSYALAGLAAHPRGPIARALHEHHRRCQP